MTPTHQIVPVVLSGGIGARLWPASRTTVPKQLLPLIGTESMIRSTIDRVSRLGAIGQTIIVTNAEHASAIRSDIVGTSYSDATLILEPVGRNTAPAVAVAAFEATASGADPLLLVLPSDHTIGDESAFAAAVHNGADAAMSGLLVTFGITPDRPETGYGYIKIGAPSSSGVFRVDAFREKPDGETANAYLESGSYLWNSGMFLIKASVFLDELRESDQVMVEAAKRSWEAADRSSGDIALDADEFASIAGDSIDYAVMEKTVNAAVVPVDPKWNDVGSWASLWDIGDKDGNGNVLIGDTIAIDVKQSYVRGSGRLIAVVGVEDLVIVDTPDALLVTTREHAQDVKQVVDKLKAERRPEIESNRKDPA
jgi:mannose-1-phosphate guanylyltransferase/mannose-6-phosphate isomerase